MSENHIVVVEELVKVYAGGTRALSGISFTVAKGEFVGFLGPNGAGKTTAVKILATLLRKTSGRALVAGHNVETEPHAVRKSIGFAMQEVGLDDLATGWDFLVLQGVLHGLPRLEARRKATELLQLVGLANVAKRRIGTYSGGMRRRIDLVAALMHSPPVLFLDEPTTGLDPQSRLAIWEHLVRLNDQGVTIFLTTHMMQEADRLCQRIAIIDQGRIVAQGTPQALKAEVGGDMVHVAFPLTNEATDQAKIAKAEELVRGRSYVAAVNRTTSSLTIHVSDASAAVPDVVTLLHRNDIPVSNLSVSSPSLDDVFLKHTGRQIRSEEASSDEAAQSARPWLGLSSRR